MAVARLTLGVIDDGFLQRMANGEKAMFATLCDGRHQNQRQLGAQDVLEHEGDEGFVG